MAGETGIGHSAPEVAAASLGVHLAILVDVFLGEAKVNEENFLIVGSILVSQHEVSLNARKIHDGFNKRLTGFMSRWMMPALCTVSIERSICKTRSIATRSQKWAPKSRR